MGDLIVQVADLVVLGGFVLVSLEMKKREGMVSFVADVATDIRQLNTVDFFVLSHC